MSPSPARPGALSTTDTLLFTAAFVAVVGSLVLWAGAAITAVLSGHAVPHVNLVAGVRALAQHGGNPSAAWGRLLAPPGCTGPRPCC